MLKRTLTFILLLATSFSCEELGNLTKPNEIDQELSHRTPAKTRHTMVLVAEGAFVWGTASGEADESPARSIELNPYYIDQFEITNALWNGYAAMNDLPEKTAPDQHPAVQITWVQADAYCRWAGLRLPTEAEWEKAARGTEAGTYPWGNGPPSRTLANFDNADGLVRVGSYPDGISPFAVHDMVGNVQEWVADWYNSAYYNSAPPRNPAGPNQGIWRGVRGSSFQDRDDLRITKRNSSHPTSAQDWIGFRCVRDLE